MEPTRQRLPAADARSGSLSGLTFGGTITNSSIHGPTPSPLHVSPALPFLRIPASVDKLPTPYRGLPPEYVTCRIFRWAVA